MAERGIDISHETVRFWWNRFGPIFAAEIRKRRVEQMRGYPQWRWHLDEVFVKINGKLRSGRRTRGVRRRANDDAVKLAKGLRAALDAVHVAAKG